MAYIGKIPTAAALTASDITDGIISSAKIADGTIVNADVNASAAIVASKLSGSGKVLQVVSTTKTDTFSMTSSKTWTDITGLTLNITPSSSSNKILLFSSINGMGTAGQTRMILRFMRDSTAIGVGAAAGSRARAGFSKLYETTDRSLSGTSGNFLDSPSSTSEITYKIQAYADSGYAVYVNRSATDTDDDTYDRTVSTITAMEIGA